MGLTQTNGAPDPRKVAYPTGTPDELRDMGYDLNEVHSCAAGTLAGVKGATILGCQHAGRCVRMFSGTTPKNGSFGPASMEPNTPGHGPEHVPLSIETAEGDEMETFMPCHRVCGSLYPRILASKDPEQPSGEKIRILGRAGEAQIVVYETLPQEPKLCNKNGNNTMVTTEKVFVVPPHPRPKDLDPRWKMRKARSVADAVDLSEGISGESKAAGRDVTHVVNQLGGDTELEGAEAPAAVAEEAPVRRRGASR